MNEEIKVQKIEYYRQVKQPTLAQYVHRRAVKEAMATVKGNTGVTINPMTGYPIPISALAAKDALKGLTADNLLKVHPQWKEDYEKNYHSGK
jgi:hypothetical protein